MNIPLRTRSNGVPRPTRKNSGGVPAGVLPPTEHRRAWMHAGLRDLAPDRAILAIGCDEAFLAAQLTEYSTDVTVLDTSAEQMGQLARRFPDITFLRHQPSTVLPFASGTFAAVWCCEFLDRMFDPAAALREMSRVLALDGRLLVTVPDHGPVRRVLRTLFQREEHSAPMHPRIRQFTAAALARLARQAGFAAVQTQAGGGRRKAEDAPRSLLLRAAKATAAVLPLAPAPTTDIDLMADPAFAGRRRAA